MSDDLCRLPASVLREQIVEAASASQAMTLVA